MHVSLFQIPASRMHSFKSVRLYYQNICSSGFLWEVNCGIQDKKSSQEFVQHSFYIYNRSAFDNRKKSWPWFPIGDVEFL